MNLVRTDARFLYQIDPTCIKKEDLPLVYDTVLEGFQKVIKDQKRHGIPYSEEEHNKRLEYKQECLDAVDKFKVRWLEINNQRDLASENVIR